MSPRLKHIILFILWSVLPAKAVCQDLMADMKRVGATYAAHDNYVFEWINYLVDSPESSESYVLKKCDNTYYLSGNGQINCINGHQQVSINKGEKTILFVDNVGLSEMPNPLQIISTLLSSEYKSKYAGQVGGLRKYICYDDLEGNSQIEIWIDAKLWRVTKVVQHLEEDLGHGFVFELKKYLPYCEAGPEISIQSYIKLDSNHKPVLVGSYKDYTLYTPDNLGEN
jgi:hypothetical protein